MSHAEFFKLAPSCFQYLTGLSAIGAGFADIYLCLGHAFSPAALPLEVQRGQPRHCYQNAAELALATGALTYCEGYALRQGLIPVHHAWCVTETGVVVDPTWAYSAGNEYLGIGFRQDFLLDHLTVAKVWGILGEHIPASLLQRPPVEFIENRWLPAADRQAELAALLRRAGL